MSVHEIDFAAQNHKNREHGSGHPLLPLCGNSPCVSQFLYCFTFPRRAGCPHPAAAWELSDVRVLRVGRGDLTPPQTQIVGETVVSRQSKRAAPAHLRVWLSSFAGGGKAFGKPRAAQRSGRAVRREQPPFVRENVHNVQKSSLTADDGFLCAEAYRFHEVAE